MYDLDSRVYHDVAKQMDRVGQNYTIHFYFAGVFPRQKRLEHYDLVTEYFPEVFKINTSIEEKIIMMLLLKEFVNHLEKEVTKRDAAIAKFLSQEEADKKYVNSALTGPKQPTIDLAVLMLVATALSFMAHVLYMIL